MKRIAHLSDLHFGKSDEAVVHDLKRDIESERPDLVVVSGDLTQRGRLDEFLQAREFLDSLCTPWIAVPGNHDLAAVYNPWGRLLEPLGRYRSHIAAELTPVYQDEEICVVGVNTARALRWKEGRLSRQQLTAISDAFGPRGHFRVLVSHHPIFADPRLGGYSLPRARSILSELHRLDVSMLLTGHLHRTHADVLESPSRAEGRIGLLSVHASTATSTRRREGPNGYHIIEIAEPEVHLQVRRFIQARFQHAKTQLFRRQLGSWESAEGTVAAATGE